MRRIEEDAEAGSEYGDTLTLPFELRQKSRLLARLDSGEEVGLFLPRGRVLRDGDLLRADDGTVVRVQAAVEEVSTAAAAGGNPRLLARAAYHLGNRHVALQVGDGWVRYQHDHVLDEMVRGLGLSVAVGRDRFEPEGGAYGGRGEDRSGRAHAHDHDHAHDHAHDHDRRRTKLLLRWGRK